MSDLAATTCHYYLNQPILGADGDVMDQAFGPFVRELGGFSFTLAPAYAQEESTPDDTSSGQKDLPSEGEHDDAHLIGDFSLEKLTEFTLSAQASVPAPETPEPQDDQNLKDLSAYLEGYTATLPGEEEVTLETDAAELAIGVPPSSHLVATTNRLHTLCDKGMTEYQTLSKILDGTLLDTTSICNEWKCIYQTANPPGEGLLQKRYIKYCALFLHLSEQLIEYHRRLLSLIQASPFSLEKIEANDNDQPSLLLRTRSSEMAFPPLDEDKPDIPVVTSYRDLVHLRNICFNNGTACLQSRADLLLKPISQSIHRDKKGAFTYALRYMRISLEDLYTLMFLTDMRGRTTTPNCPCGAQVTLTFYPNARCPNKQCQVYSYLKSNVPKLASAGEYINPAMKLLTPEQSSLVLEIVKNRLPNYGWRQATGRGYFLVPLTLEPAEEESEVQTTQSRKGIPPSLDPKTRPRYQFLDESIGSTTSQDEEDDEADGDQ